MVAAGGRAEVSARASLCDGLPAGEGGSGGVRCGSQRILDGEVQVGGAGPEDTRGDGRGEGQFLDDGGNGSVRAVLGSARGPDGGREDPRQAGEPGDPRCLEIWNLVFIQFNAEPGGKFKPLPERHVDTGMGLERVAGILATTDGFQDFRKDPSNYASDLFSPIFAKIQQISGVSYGAKVPRSREEVKPEEMNDCIFRVLADHVRTLSFSIADGIVPGNEGRNYVLRRILMSVCSTPVWVLIT